MKKILLLITLLPVLAFGQATGKDFANFPTSGSLGSAATTVDVYSRININQTTPSITLTVPTPTNTSTKVVEVWITNKGTVPYRLIALPDTASFLVDTAKFVILKWIGDKYAVNGEGSSGGSVDLSNYIKRDGTSDATTGDIKIGDGYGLEDTSSIYESRFITSEIKMFSPNSVYFDDKPIKIAASSTSFSSVFGIDDKGFTHNTVGTFSNSYMYLSNTSGFYYQHSDLSSNSYYFGFNRFDGLRIRAGNSSSRRANIRTTNFTGSGSWDYELPDKSGTFAMLSDITGGGSGFAAIVVSSNTTADNDSLYHVVASATFTDPSPVEGKGFTVFVRNGTATVGGTGYAIAGTVIRRVFHSGAWANYPNIPVSGTGGVSYNSTSGALSLNLGTSNTWTAPQTAPSWVANGTGGAGYMQLASQSSAPTAVSGSMILYSDASNRFSIVRRNNANSADITRTHLYPDGSYDWTFPTPATGTSSTLAGLNTVQTWTSQQTFTGIHRMQTLQILDQDGTTWRTALTSTTSGILSIGSGFISVATGTLSSTSVNATNGNFTSSASNKLTLRTINLGGAGATTDDFILTTGNATGSGGNSGNGYINVGTSATGNVGNLGFFTTAGSFGSGQRVIFVANRTTTPTTNPTGGYVNWSESGNPTFRTSGGGITTLGTNGIETNAGITMAYVAKTSAYTIALTDYTIDCTSGTFNVTLPTAVGITGKIFVVTNTGGGVITVDTTSSQTINGVSTKVVTTGATFQSNGSNWVLLSSF